MTMMSYLEGGGRLDSVLLLCKPEFPRTSKVNDYKKEEKVEGTQTAKYHQNCLEK